MDIRKIILEEIKYSIFEGIEHIQNLYKSWANKNGLKIVVELVTSTSQQVATGPLIKY